MNSLRTNPPHGLNNVLNMQLPLHAKTWRRDPPTAFGARAPNLRYRFTFSSLGAAAIEQPGNDPALVIDTLYGEHQQRQAMLSALAQLRGDDGSDVVW